jgi:LacI family transcriptional regulator
MLQIAAAAGVSKATVSLALRHDARITPQVRAKVQEAARKMGYRPNPLLAVHMAHLRTAQPPKWRATLGFVAHLPRKEWAESKLRPAGLCHTGALERARALGYTLEIFWLAEEGMTAGRMSRILVSRGVPGVIVAPWPRPGLGERFDLDWAHFAAATVGYSLWQPELHRACHDNYSTMGRALDKLAQRGYRRIGFATGAEDDERVNHQWLARFLAFQAVGTEVAQVPLLLTRDWNQDTFLRWVKRAKPDAIVTTRAADVMRWLAKARIRVPEKIGVLTVYWRHDLPECSGYYQNFELLGASAIDLVVAQLHRNERGLPDTPKVMMLPGEWREGSTLRPVPIAAAAG